jgi:hypothetical protein
MFQYSDQNTLYVLRNVDMDGRKFRTFIAVASWQKPTGNYAHWIEQASNELGDIKYCPST